MDREERLAAWKEAGGELGFLALAIEETTAALELQRARAAKAIQDFNRVLNERLRIIADSDATLRKLNIIVNETAERVLRTVQELESYE